MGSKGITQTKNKTKKGERNYTVEALALLNHLKPLMNVWRTLKSALDTEFKPNLNLLRAGKLQRKCSTVSNSSALQHTL